MDTTFFEISHQAIAFFKTDNLGTLIYYKSLHIRRTDTISFPQALKMLPSRILRTILLPNKLPIQLALQRMQSTSSHQMGEYESKIYDILEKEFTPVSLQVQDVLGGCGSMFAILVESSKFKGLPMIKQHRLVNDILKDEIKKWHGLQLKTKSA